MKKIELHILLRVIRDGPLYHILRRSEKAPWSVVLSGPLDSYTNSKIVAYQYTLLSWLVVSFPNKTL